MPAREDVISASLIEALSQSSAMVTRRFLREVCGQENTSVAFDFETQPTLRDERPGVGGRDRDCS